mmetsp:Transcript_16794/g.50151  ORF Transcript_16794/g.50151 Transcript_16794/m.50151 type:complete len:390 (+) Transcript_16794:234-1403(+)
MPCEAELLAADQLKDALKGPLATWCPTNDMKSVTKRLMAKDWPAAVAFVNKISEHAEGMKHHPDVALSEYRLVDLRLTTHAAGGLTRADVDLAAAIDAIPLELSPKWGARRAVLEKVDAPVVEQAATYDQSHYLEGLNGAFEASGERTVDHVQKTFAGPEKRGGGLFEDAAERDIAAATEEIVAAVQRYAGLRESSAVADVGAGTGILLPPLSRAVGARGAVAAVEPAEALRALAERRVTDEKLTNVAFWAKSNGLVEKTVDVALLVDTYHHLEYPRSTLAAIRKALQPRGHLVVIDWHRDPGRVLSKDAAWLLGEMRADQATFRREIEAAGFTHVAEPVLPQIAEKYFMVFTKTPPVLDAPGVWYTPPVDPPPKNDRKRQRNFERNYE